MFSFLSKKYNTAINRLILLDYDGTLVDFESLPIKAIPSAHLLSMLSAIAMQPCTDLIIVTGRGYFDIDGFFGKLPISIIAEHGAMIRENGRWKKQLTDIGLWKQKVMPFFIGISSACPNSFVEEKETSLTWHYRNAQSEQGYKYSRELISNLKDVISSLNLKILEGNKIVEVLNNDVDKGIAVRKLLMKNKYDFVLAIGDDKTDEDMFCVLNECNNAYTVKVGDGETIAKHKLKTVSDVLILLEQLAN
ncbi:MAG: trehalose-phosphatase [Saprospiraceae bacterium]|nr:trehalose-phosphatase [Saprospiraceae bacterium]